MNITLDSDQWQAAGNVTLGEVLADLSERAHAKSRIVTTVMLDQRRITDRDIDQHLLQEPSSKFRDLIATSATRHDILDAARVSINRYRELVVQEGISLVNPLRLGIQDVSALDRWLGKVADILELMSNSSDGEATDFAPQTTADWIEQLLEARQLRDTVRMADLLEYEILPRLVA